MTCNNMLAAKGCLLHLTIVTFGMSQGKVFLHLDLISNCDRALLLTPFGRVKLSCIASSCSIGNLRRFQMFLFLQRNPRSCTSQQVVGFYVWLFMSISTALGTKIKFEFISCGYFNGSQSLYMLARFMLQDLGRAWVTMLGFWNLQYPCTVGKVKYRKAKCWHACKRRASQQTC